VSIPAPLRFAFEAAVLVGIGVALAAADLDLLPFAVVMAAVWILVATGERLLSRPGILASVRRPASQLPPVSRRMPEAAQPAPQPPEPEPEPEPEPVREPEPERTLEVVPEPEGEQEEMEEPEPEEPVVALPQAAHRRPDGWNVWDLEQRAQEEAGRDPDRDEEWNALLIYLRDYARPDGTLPPEFDSLVQESFGELISRRA
jgi:hypothetical protein